MFIDASDNTGDILNVILKHYINLVAEPTIHLRLSLHRSENLNNKLSYTKVKRLFKTSSMSIEESLTDINPHLTHLRLRVIKPTSGEKHSIPCHRRQEFAGKGEIT